MLQDKGQNLTFFQGPPILKPTALLMIWLAFDLGKLNGPMIFSEAAAEMGQSRLKDMTGDFAGDHMI